MRRFLRRRPVLPEGFEQLQKRLGYRFDDPELLREALTHRSYANERGLGVSYERLEFLGDAVLALVSADWLYRGRPEASEGELSKLKSFLVSEPVLAAHAEDLGLGELIRLGVGEDRSGGRGKPSLLADALEAVIGAIYLDGGFAPTRAFVRQLLTKAHGARREWRYRDAKSALQELLQAAGRSVPRYVLTASEGPDHEKLFTVECRVGGETLALGVGRSKKHAEQAAAESALRDLEAREG
ncbi:MAG: ribonuclease III [Acidobacteriota bacterium]|nr:ribonuclease III [Acidobacteriota bacterium]MDH3524577.1 ribonuclease III [Acidobacteriota bacterium]